MHAVVTGAAGFIGSHLVERLLHEGWNVTAIDSFTGYYERDAKEANLDAFRRHPRVEFRETDLVGANLVPMLSNADAVFHLAAQPGVRASFGLGFDEYVHHNVLATQRVFEAALEAGQRRIVYASSSSVYGDAEAYPCIEDVTPTRPRSPYGVTKRTCEDLASVYRGLGLEITGLRYFTVYGPRQRPDMAFRRLCESACGGPAFTLFGDGGQSRDFTYVSDAVDATLRAATSEKSPPVLNVGGGEEATMLDAIALLERHVGVRLPILHRELQRGDVRRTAADCTLAHRILGWKPTVPLSDGLAMQLEWVKSNREGRRAKAAA